MSKNIRDFMKIMEASMVLDRPPTIDKSPPPKPPRPKGEPGGPKGGVYWFKGTQKINITGTCNEIVNLAGQVVMLDPEKFGFTSDEIMAELKKRSIDGKDPASEYQKYLNGVDYDLSRIALFWASSKIVFEMMLKRGWMWIYYTEDSICFVVTKEAARSQLRAVADQFPLISIGAIRVTIINDFYITRPLYAFTSDKNKTYTFTRETFPGFMKVFLGMNTWAEGGDASESNYLYLTSFISPEEYQNQGAFSLWGISAQKMYIKTPDGYRIRFAIKCSTAMPSAKEDQFIYRFHKSDSTAEGRKLVVGRKNIAKIYSDDHFYIPKTDLEFFSDGKWKKVMK